jgi:ATP-dependent DNA helicase RecQ
VEDTVDQKTKILREKFGYQHFRPGQGEIIDAVLDPNTYGVLGIMATGGGKSLLFQIPSLIYKRMTVVVSPLISLMKDQVDTLQKLGIEAQFYNSSLKKKEKDAVMNSLQMGIVDILYVAPERFDDASFIELLVDLGVDLFAIDEAHCISSWGHDFRPAYTRLKQVIDRIGPKQVIALTATATPRVQDDICMQLGIHNARRFIKGFYRDNLIVKIDDKAKGNARFDKVVNKVHGYHKKDITTGVVYTATKKNAEMICERLQNRGVNASFYHAGMKDSDRKEVQERWANEGGTIVATCAFGMGIDKPDVRFVIHVNMPGNLESWYQEIGRAGRDGNPSVCQMYFGGDDIYLQKFFIDMSNPEPDDVRQFWLWIHEVASHEDSFGDKVILKMTQQEMGEQCGSVQPSIISACISALKKSGVVQTIGRGAYKIQLFENPYNAPIDYDSLRKKRQEKMDRLNEMINFVNDKNRCRFQHILGYFGDSMKSRCGKCDWCQKQDGRM